MKKLQFFLYGILFLNIAPLCSSDAPTPIFYQTIVHHYRHLHKGFQLMQLESSFYDFLTSQLSCKKFHDENFSTILEQTIADAEYSVLSPMRETFLEIITMTARKSQPHYKNLEHPYFVYIQQNHQKFFKPWIKEWINVQDSFGNSLLHRLVNTKVSQQIKDQPHYQLACLAHILHNIIAMGADVNMVNANGTSPLHLVQNYEITKMLLKARSNPNIQDKQGITPLHMACRHTAKKDQSFTKMLLCYGANPELCDQRGLKPIHQAAQYNNEIAIQDFIQAGVDVNSQDSNGWTPLHYAAKLNPDETMTQLLIRHNADIDSKTHDKITPLYLAVQYNHRATVQTLLNAGADITILDRKPSLKVYKEMHDILQEARNQRPANCTVS
jgi:ankyrin repeat protein